MKTIETRYIGPSNTKESRIMATDWSGEHLTYVSYDDALSSEGAHAEAALKLARKLGWTGQLVSGSTKAGYVFVFINGNIYTI